MSDSRSVDSKRSRPVSSHLVIGRKPRRFFCWDAWIPIRLSFLALSLLSGPVGVAQEEASGDETTFFDVVDVEVVNVEVFVTDKSGQPVTGLTVDDFELFEDRRPVEITNFYAVDGGRPVVAPSAPEIPEGGEGVGADRPRLRLDPLVAESSLPEEQRLSLVIYFDNLFLKPFSRNKVAREVRKFVAERIGPDDRVMVVTFERSLHVRQPFTSDRRLIADALFEIEDLSALAVQTASARSKVIDQVESSRTYLEAEGFVDFHAKEVFNDLGRALEALDELVTHLGGLPGRKAVLYVSDGVPMTAGEDLFQFLDLKYGSAGTGGLQAQRYSARDRFQDLTAAANSSRVTLYTMEAAGLRSHSSLSAESRGSAAGGSQLEIDLARDFNIREPLLMMAEITGGQATISTNAFAAAFDRMANDFRSFYSLGYVPAHGGDGRKHSLQVKVGGKGLEVRHRKSYRAKSRETRMREGVLAALRFGGGDGNPLELELETGYGTRRDDGYFQVPVTVKVPFRRVSLIPRAEKRHGRLQLVIAVIDEDGDTSPPESTTLPLEIPESAFEAVQGESVIYTAQLVMRRGHHEVAVVIRDELSGQTSVVRRAVVVGG